jgi:putative DNA methylase
MRQKKNGEGRRVRVPVGDEATLFGNASFRNTWPPLGRLAVEGWVPDMRIEVGGPPRYQGLDLVRARGWSHWHHLFSVRQLLVNAILNRHSEASLKPAFLNLVQQNARLSRWDPSGGGRAGIKQVFDNQALNTLFNYGARGTGYIPPIVDRDYKSYPLSSATRREIAAQSAGRIVEQQDLFVTDPPYGDAVKYEEILDFFIAWLRKNPPPEFADWVWDSRRSLAIQGEGEDFPPGHGSGVQADDRVHVG